MKRKSSMLIAFCIMLFLLVACGSNLSDDEKYMVKCAKQVSGEYGIGADYTITDDPWVIKTDSQTYAVIPFSGQTDSGSPKFGIAIFVDGAYYMDGMEDTDDLDKLIVLRNINAADAYGFEKIEVNKDTIMEEMK